MICEKCSSQLHYGDKFCNICGEKIDKSAYEADYNKTVWGIIDKGTDWYETIFLKKITGNWIFKVLLLLIIAAWGFLDAYTDFTSIKILESESYSIEYNKRLDEYYIRTSEEEININLYIPGYTDNIKVKEFTADEVTEEKDMTPEEYKDIPITVKKNSFEYLTVDSIKNDKISDNIKIYVMD